MMWITGLEANFLLFALDAYLGVDALGKIMSTKHGYSREEVQHLRNRLFDNHQHPKEEYE